MNNVLFFLLVLEILHPGKYQLLRGFVVYIVYTRSGAFDSMASRGTKQHTRHTQTCGREQSYSSSTLAYVTRYFQLVYKMCMFQLLPGCNVVCKVAYIPM